MKDFIIRKRQGYWLVHSAPKYMHWTFIVPARCLTFENALDLVAEIAGEE